MKNQEREESRKEYTKIELAEKAYDILKDVPQHNWIEHSFTNGKDKCCAISHLNRYEYKEHDKDYSFKTCMPHHNDTKISHIIRNSDLGTTIMNANDNWGESYTQYGSNPKDRVINFLEEYIRNNKVLQ